MTECIVRNRYLQDVRARGVGSQQQQAVLLSRAFLVNLMAVRCAHAITATHRVAVGDTDVSNASVYMFIYVNGCLDVSVSVSL